MILSTSFKVAVLQASVIHIGINMKSISIGNGKIQVPEIGLGCMRIKELKAKEAVRELIDTAMDHGINFSTMRIYMQEEEPRKYLVT